MSENKNCQIAEQEELFGEDLRQMVRFTDLTQRPKALEQEADSMEDDLQDVGTEPGKVGKMLLNCGSLVAADALLMFMCMADKIDLAYGLVFLAVASAFFGARVNNARL